MNEIVREPAGVIKSEHSKDKTITNLFEEQAEKTPQQIAVVFEEKQLTYKQLNERSNQLAHYLIKRGVKEETLVPICIERSLEMIVGILGILKAGGAYVPIDPDYPGERISFMLNDTKATIVLSSKSGISKIEKNKSLDIIQISEEWPEISRESKNNPVTNLNPHNLAYAIYTSGSTGKPKGVLIEHRNIVSLFKTEPALYNFSESDTWTMFHSFCFDFSVWEMFGALLFGGRLVIVPYHFTRDAELFSKLLVSEKVTILNQTPSAFYVLQECIAGNIQNLHLRYVIFGGESLHPAKLRVWKNQYPSTRIVNMYGITETTVHVTYQQIEQQHIDSGNNVIGKPIPSLKVYIFDSFLHLLPAGVAGEMYVGGDGVARGYLNRDKLTHERFINDPFSAGPGSRLYKTGDLAKWLPDGSLEYLGRADDQVKIRGFRIEPGEIESCMSRIPGVRDAKVFLAENEFTANKHLNAYVQVDKARFPMLSNYQRLINDGIINKTDLKILPNGLPVISRNPDEAGLLYQEIFVEHSWLKHGITLNEDSYVIDVGANVGLFSIFLNVLSKNINVYSIEPVPEVYDQLLANRYLYGVKGKALQLAVMDTEQEFEIKPGSKKIQVKAKTLSQIITGEKIPKIDLLKVDVENTEHYVINGLCDKDWDKIDGIIIKVNDIDGRLKTIGELIDQKGFETYVEKEQMLSGDNAWYTIYAKRNKENKALTGPGDKENFKLGGWLHPAELIKNVKKEVEANLPDYMMPSGIILVESFPLTPNGKIDKKALLNVSNATRYSHEYVEPGNEAELRLTLIWQTLLGADKIGIDDNFFELGGHSLLAIQLTSVIRKMQRVNVLIKDLYSNPTIGKLAKHISTLNNIEHIPIEQVKLQQHYPLSSFQKGLWLDYKIDPPATTYNVYGSYFFTELNEHLFNLSIADLLKRHEILRTIFIEVDGFPMQKIIDSNQLKFSIATIDSSKEKEAGVQVKNETEKIYAARFILDQWPLFRLVLIKERSGYRFVYCMHHIITDGWSMEIFIRDLVTIYESKLAQVNPLLPDLPVQYKDYSNWQNDLLIHDYDQQKNYWKSRLAGELSFLRLPVDNNIPVATSSTKANYYNIYIEKELNLKIKEFVFARKISCFSFLITCFKILLSRLTTLEDIIIAIPVANRDHDDIKDLMGIFVNILVMRGKIEKGSSVEQCLMQVSNNLMSDLQNQSYPFELLMKDLKIHRDHKNQFPITSVFLNMLNFNKLDKDLGVSKTVGHGESSTSAKINLQCYFKDYEDSIEISCVYKKNLFNSSTIEYWINNFVSIIEQAVMGPSILIKDLAIFTTHHFTGNDPVPVNTFEYFDDHAIEQTIVSRFEDMVKKFPQNIAIYEGGTQINYFNLNCLANGLAGEIINKKKHTKFNIALLLTHGKAAVIGMLGVLKTGNAYVPLDPAYPVERLKYIIKDTGCDLIITCSENSIIAKTLINDVDKGLIIDLDRDIIPVEKNPNIKVSNDSLAYILYTSGSTGEPKGVQQCHRNVLHFIRVYTNNLHINCSDRLSFLSPYTYDSSVQDVYGSLLNGSALFSYDFREKGISDLPQWIRENKLSIIHIVPTLYRLLLSSFKGVVFDEVRLVVLGGEPVYKKDFDDFKNHFKEGTLFVNGYGATESTIVFQKFFNHDSIVEKRNLSIGFPVHNTKVSLLDRNGEEVAINETGEIFYTSNFLALGYWNKIKETALAFTPHPTNKSRKIYRSGDLGRMLPTGEMEFIGRNDNQVKLNGQRVEISEIEQNLLKIKGVDEAIVLIKTWAQQVRLTAYVRSEKKVSEQKIKQILSEALPFYMLPAIYVFVDKFPVTLNGKIDRKALPEPDSGKLSGNNYVAPRNEAEVKLAGIWQKLLHAEKVGVEDNFFTMGGDSLLAILLQNEIKKGFHKNLPLAALLKIATIGELATHLCEVESKKLWCSLVPIQPTGFRPPLFLVHEGTGEVFTYRNLANRLGPDQPVFGLQAQGLDGHTKPFVSIEDMAAHYIKEVESIQTDGPYFLGGLCLGGIIALEMAQQLKENGKQVEMLIFFGTPVNTLSPGREPGSSPPGKSNFLNYLSRLTSKDRLVYLLRHYWKILRRPLFNKKGHLFGNVVWERIYVNTLKAVKNYKPKIYSGNLISFWASNDRRFSAVEQSRWCNIISGDVRSYNFPRDHISHVLNGPYCKNAVEILTFHLDESPCVISKKTRLETAKSIAEVDDKTNRQSPQNESPSWCSLVPIQTKAPAPLLFCIHGAEDTFTGEIHYAYDLARFFGPMQSVYGLQAQGLDGKSKPHLRIESMAAHYINEIQTIQPNGPYFLCGVGFGGLVALEMAQQLNSLAQKIALVTLIDSININKPSTLPSKNNDSLSKQVKTLKRVKEFKTKTKNKFLINLCHFIKYPLPNLLTYFHLRQTFMRAKKSYIAKVYEGKVAIFCSGGKSINTYEGISLNKLVNGETAIYNNPFDHDLKDTETQMQELADKLKSTIQNAFIN